MDPRADTDAVDRKRHMKGIVASCAVRFLRKWLRTQPEGLVLGLTDSAQKLLDTRLLPSSWYDYYDYMELMESIRVNVMDGDLDKIADLAAAGAPVVYGGAHKMLIKQGDPKSTIRVIQALWSTCQDFGRASVVIGESEATVCVRDALPMSEIEGYINLGWIRGILEISGAAGLSAEILEKPWEGSKDLLLHYRWM